MIKAYHRYLIIALLACTIIIPAKGQDSFNASGGDASGNGGTVAYSIGQLVYTTQVGTNGISEQGVQHAFNIFTSDIHEPSTVITLTAFPNPVADQLALQINDYKGDLVTYQLIDIQGKLLNTAQIVSQQTLINMANLPAGTYFLNLFNQEQKQLQLFKILKK